MKNKKIYIFIILLLVITGIAAFAHLSTRDVVPENGIQVIVNGDSKILDIDNLKYENVTGSYVTGKGEEREVDGPGISLEAILKEASVSKFTKVSVTSDDSYSVEITAEENAEAYLLHEEDSLRLIVFGDKDSKRNVKNVMTIEVE